MNVMNLIDWIAVVALGGMMFAFIIPLIFVLLIALQDDPPFY